MPHELVLRTTGVPALSHKWATFGVKLPDESSGQDRSRRSGLEVALRRPSSPETEARVEDDQEATGLRLLEPEIPVAPMERAKLESLEIGSRLQVLQSWEGRVTDINAHDGEFTARLVPLSGAAREESEAVFDINDVSSNDRDLLQVGGVFQWIIGYRRYSYGQMERVSAINFRRLPAWYEDDLRRAIEEGENLAAAFSIE